jgi:hypothetical protein
MRNSARASSTGLALRLGKAGLAVNALGIFAFLYVPILILTSSPSTTPGPWRA